MHVFIFVDLCLRTNIHNLGYSACLALVSMYYISCHNYPLYYSLSFFSVCICFALTPVIYFVTTILCIIHNLLLCVAEHCIILRSMVFLTARMPVMCMCHVAAFYL